MRFWVMGFCMVMFLFGLLLIETHPVISFFMVVGFGVLSFLFDKGVI